MLRRLRPWSMARWVMAIATHADTALVRDTAKELDTVVRLSESLAKEIASRSWRDAAELTIALNNLAEVAKRVLAEGGPS